MDLRTPMRLFRDQELVGFVTKYGYETPWATGLVQDSDPERGKRSDRAAMVLRWLAQHEGDLSEDDEEYERVYDCEVARQGITRADVDWCEGGTWTVQTQDGMVHPAHSLDFIGSSWVQWRW